MRISTAMTIALTSRFAIAMIALNIASPCPALARDRSTACGTTAKRHWPSLTRPPIVTAGRSLDGIMIGETRAKVWSALQRRPDKIYKLPHGRTEDDWITAQPTADGDTESVTISAIYEQGAVVQVNCAKSSAGDDPFKIGPFAALLAADRHLRKSCYSVTTNDQDGYIEFYYDDATAGIAYAKGVQDDFILTYCPDTVIVHAPGKDLMVGTPDATVEVERGSAARAYKSQAEADKADKS